MMTRSGNMTSWLNNIFILFILLIPCAVSANGYVELVGVPGIADASNITINEYINALYRLSIGIAALLAVLKLILAGAKYVLSDVVTTKEGAKKDIYTSILGLIIVIAAVLILQTINRDLTNFGIFSSFGTVNATSTYTAPPRTEQEVAIDALCASEGGCTRLGCGSIDEWGPEYPGSQIGNGIADCPARCTFMGGELEETERLIGTDRVCIVSTSASGAQLEEEAQDFEESYRSALAGELTFCNTSSTPTCNEISELCSTKDNFVSVSTNNANSVTCSFTESEAEVSPDEETTYYILRTDDEVIAGVEAQQITIVSTDPASGFVLIELSNGTQQELACNRITPNVCN